MSEFKFLIIYISLFAFYVFFLGYLAPSVAEEYNLNAPNLVLTNDLIQDVGNIWTFFMELMNYYISLFSLTPEITILSAVFVVTGIGLLWILITKLIIPLIEAIGNLIPFT